jgi:cytochrome b involved in lipid metabolism
MDDSDEQNDDTDDSDDSDDMENDDSDDDSDDDSAAVMPPANTTTMYTMADVQANNTESACWTTIRGNVYNLSAWIDAHP